jgi:uncharacterized RDD family membrane protein YckC
MQQPYTAYASEPTDLFTEKQVIYASFWQRFVAALIDGIILMFPNFCFNYLFGPRSGSYYMASIVTGWLYYALMESGEGQATLGKRAMKIKVVNMQGERISFANASGRHFAKFISAIIIFIGYLMMLWDEKKQTLHDKIAGTLVVAGEIK